MRVLVTGATGFVGSNLAHDLVERGESVRVLRRSSSSLSALEGIPVEFVTGDVLDPESLTEATRGCDLVFHVAAVSQYWRNSSDVLYKINVDGTRNVLQAAMTTGVERMVFTSSVAALGYSSDGKPVDETQAFPEQLSWFSYGHSKHLAELEVQKAVAKGFQVVTVNPAVVVGPRDVNFVSGSVIKASVKGQLRAVPPGGTNYVHVSDVVTGHIQAAERGRTGERYILGGENLSHLEAARIVSQVTGGPGPMLTLPKWSLLPLARLVDLLNKLTSGPPLIIGQQILLGGEIIFVDSSKAIRELGLSQTTFRQAASDAYEWYRKNGLL